MKYIIDKFFSYSKNLSSIELGFQKIKKKTNIDKIFNSINNQSEYSEVRYVGGCIRQILNDENVNDIDLATNLTPTQVCDLFKVSNIKYYKTGIEHGTITGIVNNHKFEITSLRKDVETDGRHAKVQYSKKWLDDASRRDFTINSIYADIHGNIFDPFNGKKDLENGEVKFIGDVEKRIREDYLRILRYLRFFLNYSKKKHNKNVKKIIKKNLDGFVKISSDRLLDEFKKLVKSKNFLKIAKDDFCFEIIQLVFPQFKNLNILKKLNSYAQKNIIHLDFISLLSLIILDGSDNVEYFIYKFNISKKDQKRLLFLNGFFSTKINSKNFSYTNLNKILYFEGKEALLDLLNFQVFRSKKIDKKLIETLNFFKDKEPPVMPLKASTLIEKYNIPQSKELGLKLKKIETKWVDNDFTISEKDILKLINS